VDALRAAPLPPGVHLVDLIRQKSGAITGARPTGRLGAARDDDGEQSTSARLRRPACTRTDAWSRPTDQVVYAAHAWWVSTRTG
jgi:hypothetical protein